MIERYYSKLDLQLASISFFLVISSLLTYILNFVPLLRASFWTFLTGLLGGAFLFVITQALLLFGPKIIKSSQTTFTFNKLDLAKTLGKLLVQATGEETLLRGFIFIPFVTFTNFFGSTLLAFILNAILSTFLYSSRNKINYIVGIQASLIALFYLISYSMFTVIIARLTLELLILLESHYKWITNVYKRKIQKI